MNAYTIRAEMQEYAENNLISDDPTETTLKLLSGAITSQEV